MDKLVVKELIQDELTVDNCRKELNEILHNEYRIKQLKADYAALKDLLSQGGHASAKAAKSIVEFLKTTS
jgi:lipid-A-disaccharide synthase